MGRGGCWREWKIHSRDSSPIQGRLVRAEWLLSWLAAHAVAKPLVKRIPIVFLMPDHPGVDGGQGKGKLCHGEWMVFSARLAVDDVGHHFLDRFLDRRVQNKVGAELADLPQQGGRTTIGARIPADFRRRSNRVTRRSGEHLAFEFHQRGLDERVIVERVFDGWIDRWRLGSLFLGSGFVVFPRCLFLG